MNRDLERRQYPRVQVCEGTFAFINNVPFAVLNVSRGGMKLQTALFDDATPAAGANLDIFRQKENFYLENIPVRRVRVGSSRSVSPFSTREQRNFGIQFGELTEQQKTRLDYFISQCSAIEV